MAALALALLPGGVRGQLPSRQILDRVSRSVVRVEARRCRGADAVGTGFVWGRTGQVVTALHGVAGCDDVVVYSETLGVSRRGRVSRALTDADLALLDVSSLDLPALSHQTSQPTVNARVVAMGYKLGAPTLGTANLEVSYGSRTLRDIVPRSVAERLARAGSPSLSLQILNLQGHLLPGLSGAPVIDDAGRVVAVANGGLEGGAASISWAIPAERLDHLATAGAPMAGGGVATRELFSATLEAPSTDVSALACGELSLVQVRQRTLAQLRATTDDPQGLAFLEQFGSLVNLDLSQLQYDIYVDTENGGTVAVPSGLTLQQQGPSCVADLYGGGMRLVIAGYRDTDPELAELDFLSGFGGQGLTWQQDGIQFSSGPLWRPDGLTSNRNSATGYQVSMFNAIPRINLFSTSVGLGDDFVGAAVVNTIPGNIDSGRTMAVACGMGSPECQTLQQQMRMWMWLIAGSYFTTFPVG